MSNPAEVVVLAEDERQFRFVSAWVRNRVPNLPGRNIRALSMSNGRGSGAQRVITQYEPQVRAHLTRHAWKWLIVVIDADNLTVLQRITQLTQKLQDSDNERIRASHENLAQVAHLVPKWSIETWILFLNGEIVNEEKPYKNQNRDWDQWIKSAAIGLQHLIAQNDAIRNYLPSLAQGLRELRMLTPKI